MKTQSEQRAEIKERKRWLSTLLDRMTAPADVMRQHLDAQDQNATLGSAAEAGVRDILRVVLPHRLAVTSGFLREAGRSSLAEKNPQGTISPQTDVVVYDASQATPLHGIGGIDIVAASDVLGVIEVKDTIKGSEELCSSKGEGGALGHMTRLGAYVPYAFRGIILFRGKEVEHGKDSGAEIELAKERFKAAALESYQVPHVVYCASCAVEKGAEGSYLAFYDFRAKTVCIYAYHGDKPPALAGFLRIVTGFFAAKGLISPSLHLDVLPAKPPLPPVELPTSEADPPHDTLHRRLLDRRVQEEPAPFFRLFVDVLQQEAERVDWHVVTGRDADSLPTAGFIVLVSWRERSRPSGAAFFYLVAPRVFACTDAGSDEAQRWAIEHETVDDYMRRALRESGLDPTYNFVRQQRAQPDGTTPEALSGSTPSSGSDPEPVMENEP